MNELPKQLSATETRFHLLVSDIASLYTPLGSKAVFHLTGCNKYELMDLANKVNAPLTKPEDNLYADCYTLKIDYKENQQILLHSAEQVIKKPVLSDLDKMKKFTEELSLITGPEISDQDLREHLEVVLNSLHESTKWLKQSIQNKKAA